MTTHSVRLSSYNRLTKAEQEMSLRGRPIIVLGSHSYYRKGDKKRFYEYSRRLLVFDDQGEAMIRMNGQKVPVLPVRTTVNGNGSVLTYVTFMLREETDEAKAIAQAEALHNKPKTGRVFSTRPTTDY